ncbi:uncharacterized protein (DUF58 family) [Mumia flava]|uniref:Uncharacterized protein (DUF58 family) n=1 Tax=Mumia flava TaxID=1348852 RepID=A0A2M9BDJ8_9ACTN|nr:DUF58 domain-containing protein [Mumia flava]PJJ56035.1 uncharacterized protein (DUF58 family) [Mumia flava]
MRAAVDALTTRGRAFLASGVAVLAAAAVLGLEPLLRIGVLALLWPVLTVLLVLRARTTVRARRTLAPARVSAGDLIDVRLVLDGTGRGAGGTTGVTERIPDAIGSDRRFRIRGGRRRWTCTIDYHLRPRRRGVYQIGPTSIRVTDPFGFLAFSRTFRSTSPLVVTPVVHPLGTPHTSGSGSDEGEHRIRLAAAGRSDDATVREYRRGDDLRRIHWRSTARAGELMVRREEEGRDSDLVVYLDTRRAAHTLGDDGSFEWAVSAAASVVSHVAARGWDVRLVTDATRSHDAAPETLSLILDELAAVRPSVHRDPVPIDPALVAGRGAALAIVSATDADILDRLHTVTHGARDRLAFVLDPAAWRVPSGPTASAADVVESARAGGWASVVVGPRTTVSEAWRSARVGALTREQR